MSAIRARPIGGEKMGAEETEDSKNDEHEDQITEAARVA
jgi:hypothetical protein